MLPTNYFRQPVSHDFAEAAEAMFRSRYLQKETAKETGKVAQGKHVAGANKYRSKNSDRQKSGSDRFNAKKPTDNPKAGAGGNWDTINEKFDPDVVKQHTNTSCGAACAEMLLRDRDIFVNQTKFGTQPKSAPELARDLNNASNSNKWEGNGLSPSSFDALNRTGSWAAMLVDITGSNTRHWVVVKGVDKGGNVIIHDPWQGTSYTMTRNNFINTWTGYSVYAR